VCFGSEIINALNIFRFKIDLENNGTHAAPGVNIMISEIVSPKQGQ
jgi:hypothetical protein